MSKSLSILFFTLLITHYASASTPPNSPQQLTPTHNFNWSDSQAVPPGNITFTWKDNGDAENNPLWFYFYLIKWNGSDWVVDTKTYTSAQGVTTITKNLSAGFYAWQVAAVDATKSSTPWHAWADLNGDGLVTAADWSFLVVKTQTTTTPPADCSTSPCFYISPSGNDLNNGTSPSTPWKTFNKAIPQLDPGEILILMDGTYTKTTTGLPNITCGKNAKNGTASNRITIKAQNERKAWLKSDGSVPGFDMKNCSWWVVEGLRTSSADLSAAEGGTQVSGPFHIGALSHDIVVRRILASNCNRYFNQGGIVASGGDNGDVYNVLIEEVESYDCHRHMISGGNGSHHITIRRSYANPRAYTRCKVSPEYYCGEYPISLYDSADSIIENSIAERTLNGFALNESTDNSKVLGSIALNSEGNGRGLHANSRNTTSEFMSNPFFKDVVILNSGNREGVRITSVENARMENITVINSKEEGIYTGLGSYPIPISDPRPSTFAINILSIYNRLAGIKVGPDGIPNWSFDYVNSYGNGDNFDPDDFSCPNCFSNVTQIDPKMYNPTTGQGCIVYVPQSSPMKGAGKNGADIGANIVYRYVDGVLTSQKLWDQQTGAFPCGAIVPGVNDIPGQSCFDVHQRLNVGVNGCPIP